MSILRVLITGYGNLLYVGKIPTKQLKDFRKYCVENDLDLNEVWYENENDEIQKFFDVADCLELDDLANVEGVAFQNKSELDRFISDDHPCVKLKIYYENQPASEAQINFEKINLFLL